MGRRPPKSEAWFRFATGFLLGLVLTALALFLTGAGHGTYAPVIANASAVVLIPGVGFLLAIFAPPLQWGLYFAMVPAIKSRLRRRIVLGLIVLAHLIPGVVLAAEDSAFTRILGWYPGLVTAYAVTLVVTLIVLSLLCGERRSRS